MWVTALYQSKAKDTRLLNTTKVVKAKLSPTFNLTTFKEYLTELYSIEGYQGRVGSHLGGHCRLVVYCLMSAEQQRALLSSKLLKKAKTVVCANRLKECELQTKGFNQMKWVDLAKPVLPNCFLFLPNRMQGMHAYWTWLDAIELAHCIHPLSRTKSSLICMSLFLRTETGVGR